MELEEELANRYPNLGMMKQDNRHKFVASACRYFANRKYERTRKEAFGCSMLSASFLPFCKVGNILSDRLSSFDEAVIRG